MSKMFELPILIISMITITIVIGLCIYYYIRTSNMNKSIDNNIDNLTKNINSANMNTPFNNFNFLNNINSSNIDILNTSLSNINKDYITRGEWFNKHFTTDVIIKNEDDYLTINKNLQTSNITSDYANINTINLKNLCIDDICIDSSDILRRDNEILTNNSITNDIEHKSGLTGRHGLDGKQGSPGIKGPKGIDGKSGQKGKTGPTGLNISSIYGTTDTAGQHYFNIELENNVITNTPVQNFIGTPVRNIDITSFENSNALSIQYTNGTYSNININASSGSIIQSLSNNVIAIKGLKTPVGHNQPFTINANGTHIRNGLNINELYGGLGVGTSNVQIPGNIYATNKINTDNGNFSTNTNINNFVAGGNGKFNKNLTVNKNIKIGNKNLNPITTNQWLTLDSSFGAGELLNTNNLNIIGNTTINGLTNINNNIDIKNNVKSSNISWDTVSITNENINSSNSIFIKNNNTIFSACNMDINNTRLSGNYTGCNNEIANDTSTIKQLSITGNGTTIGSRKVGISNNLNVSGNLTGSNITIKGKLNTGGINSSMSGINTTNVYIQNNLGIGQNTQLSSLMDSNGKLTCSNICIGSTCLNVVAFSNLVYKKLPQGPPGINGAFDCAVTQWSNVGICTVPCGGGIQQETRKVVYNATTVGTDTGAECPILSQAPPCNTGLCCKNISGEYSSSYGPGVTIKMTSNDTCWGTYTDSDNNSYTINASPGAITGCNWNWGNLNGLLRTDGIIKVTDGSKLLPGIDNVSKLPRGTYLQSCQYCQLIGNVLQCQCLSNDIVQPLSSINIGTYPASVTKNIASNVNGKLGNVVDCVMSPWSAWSACDQNTGIQTATRTVQTPAQNGGTVCPTDLVKTQACKVDCQVTGWTNNGGCTKTCGGGKQKQTRSVNFYNKNGGSACPDLSQELDCNTHGCAVDCQGYHDTNWSSCSASCGGGLQYKYFNVTTSPANGGTACPGTKSQQCNTHACCNGGWSGCSRNCNGGTQRYDTNGTSGCSTANGTTQSCNTQSCNGTAQQWTHGNNGAVSCDKYCRGPGNGSSWNNELPSYWNGAKSVSEYWNGNGRSCLCEATGQGWAVDCQGYWSGYTGCSSRCGWGTNTKNFIVTQYPQNGGAACPDRQEFSCHDGSGCPPPPPPPPQYKPITSILRGNYAIDIEGAYNHDGAYAHMWDLYNNGNQQWKNEHNQLKVKHTDKCLDVVGAGTHNGARVAQYGCHGGANQKWHWYGDTLRPGHALHKCLDVAWSGTGNGTELRLWDCNGSSAQRFSH